MSDYQVGPGTFVTLASTVFDAEGEVVAERDVLGVVFGLGGLLPRVEESIEGRLPGDRLSVELAPAEAYGKRDDKRILEVDRADFPDTVKPGDRFEVENDEGAVLVIHVLDVQGDSVVIDTNHPLADQKVRVEVEILEVRPATTEEIEGAEAQLAEDEGYLQVDAPDVSASSLVRGGPRP